MRLARVVIADDANEPDMQQLDPEVRELSHRRDFLRRMNKWSTAAIAAILLIDSPTPGTPQRLENSRSTWNDFGCA